MAIIVTREAIYSALFSLMSETRLNGEEAFVYKSRRRRTTDDIGSMRQPAMIMWQGMETVKRTNGLPAIQNMPVTFWLLFRPTEMMMPVGNDAEMYPETLINNYVDAFQNQLEPPTLSNAPGGKQSLGGLVTHARVEGQILFDSGLTDNQAVITIPVEILATR